MGGGDNAFSEGENTQAFDGFTRLLQGKTIALRASIKAVITFIKRKRNAAVQTGDRQCYAADTAINNRHMRVVFGIRHWRLIGCDQSWSATVHA